MDLRIERAAPEDGPAILRLLGHCGLPTEGLLGHVSTAVVARGQAGVVGSAALEVYADGALLRSVAVDATMRGCGLGHRLTESAIDLARTFNVPAVYLLTTTAEEFFPKLGFQPIDREDVPAGVRTSVEFQSACPASAVAMRRVLDDPSQDRPSS